MIKYIKLLKENRRLKLEIGNLIDKNYSLQTELDLRQIQIEKYKKYINNVKKVISKKEILYSEEELKTMSIYSDSRKIKK